MRCSSLSASGTGRHSLFLVLLRLANLRILSGVLRASREDMADEACLILHLPSHLLPPHLTITCCLVPFHSSWSLTQPREVCCCRNMHAGTYSDELLTKFEPVVVPYVFRLLKVSARVRQRLWLYGQLEDSFKGFPILFYFYLEMNEVFTFQEIVFLYKQCFSHHIHAL